MSTTVHQDWIRRRKQAVLERYSAFDALVEFGHGGELVDPDTPVQMFCPFHDNKNTPAARYYPASGHRSSYVHCYGSCKASWDGVSMLMRFRGVEFMEALKELERRFKIKVPQRPEESLPEPKDRSSPTYESESWGDVQRVLAILEKKLSGLRGLVSMQDYVKFCRVLDAVQWDYDAARGQQSHEMVSALARLRQMMDSPVSSGKALADYVMDGDGSS